MNHSKRSLPLPLLIIALIFIGWSIVFIYRVSFIAIDGRRYVNLFDDAMISARYAWNFAQGNGLVWNPGEYVEGYSNLLMTLLMSLVMVITGDKRLSVLLIHISGIVFMLIIAWATMSIADHLSRSEPDTHRRWLLPLTFAGTLFYYPLAYWSLMGMETGLLTALIILATLTALRYADQPAERSQLFLTALFLGLAYLARPDAVIAAVIIFLFISYEIFQDKDNPPLRWTLLVAAGLFALFLVSMQLFRISYYGEALPNTYYLKATGWPLSTRIRNGILFIIPFARTTLPALVLMVMAVLLGPNDQRIRRHKLLLVILAVAYIYYQIWIGGDAFPPYWRMMTPIMPLVLLLSIQAISYLSHKILRLAVLKLDAPSRYDGPLALVITIILLVVVNIGFWPELTLLARPYETKSNEYHVNTAIALNDLTTPEATIGVTSAGTVPFYSENRKAIDFLGKSDKYIARLPADVSGYANFKGMISLPGHNKYDLEYSIKTLRPTYVQTAVWGDTLLDDWVQQRYTTVYYQGVSLYLLNGSPAVLWDNVTALSK